MTLFIIITIITVMAMVAWYEHQLVKVTNQLNDLLDYLEELNDETVAPPFNLITWHPQPQPKLALVSDQVFSRAEIEEWN
jgi:hypothetical protein